VGGRRLDVKKEHRSRVCQFGSPVASSYCQFSARHENLLFHEYFKRLKAVCQWEVLAAILDEFRNWLIIPSIVVNANTLESISSVNSPTMLASLI
jgi:hypothetical protein